MTKIIEKYKALADRLVKDIADKRRPRDTNTPKKAMQAVSARIEADHLERVRDACLVLAKSEANGSDWIGTLRPVYTKADLLKMTKTKIEHPSYYTLVDTGVFYDQSPEAVKLRSLVDASKDPAAAAEKAKADRIAELIEKVRFANIPGFFPTPNDVVDWMLYQAKMPHQPCRVLEPSAGIGSIADKIDKKHHLKCFEIVPALCDVLQAKGHDVLHHDFLAAQHALKFDRIIMNPPFERGQDGDHVRHAYDMLADGGRLVAIVSPGLLFRQDKKSTAFREWFASVNGEQYDLPDVSAFNKPDAFRKTAVQCKLIAIDK